LRRTIEVGNVTGQPMSPLHVREKAAELFIAYGARGLKWSVTVPLGQDSGLRI